MRRGVADAADGNRGETRRSLWVAVQMALRGCGRYEDCLPGSLSQGAGSW
jgi:hypothetical protein